MPLPETYVSSKPDTSLPDVIPELVSSGNLSWKAQARLITAMRLTGKKMNVVLVEALTDYINKHK